jgi:hypothetical protein
MIPLRKLLPEARTFLWAVGAAAAALILGWGSVNSLYVSLGATVALAASALWAARMSPKYWLLIGILCVFASSTSLFDNGTFSVLARLSGLSAIALGGLIAKRNGLMQSLDQDRFRADRFAGILLPLLAFLSFAALPHGQYFQFFGYFSGVVLIWVSLWSTTYVSRRDLRFALVWSLGGLIIGSILTGFFLPSIAIEGERLRGLANNANLLGFYAFILAGIVFLSGRWGTRSIVLVVAAVIAIVSSASRASMLAVVVVVAFSALMTAGISRKLVIGVGLLILPISAIWSQDLAAIDIALFRDNNSRDSSFSNAMLLFSAHPMSGIGMDDSLVIASSPLRALAYAGIWGAICITFIYAGILSLAFRANLAALSFSVAAIVHSVFEGWLLSPISPLFVVFMLCLLLLVRSSTAATSRSLFRWERHEPALPGQIPGGRGAFNRQSDPS